MHGKASQQVQAALVPCSACWTDQRKTAQLQRCCHREHKRLDKVQLLAILSDLIVRTQADACDKSEQIRRRTSSWAGEMPLMAVTTLLASTPLGTLTTTS